MIILWANTAIDICFYFSKKIGCVDLHEKSKPIYWEMKEKHYKILNTDFIFTQHETNTPELLYNTFRYRTVMDTRQFTDGIQNMLYVHIAKQTCMNHIEKRQ